MSDRAASFGNVTAEYQAARNGAAVGEDLHEILWVDGSDAISFLDGQLSQDIARIPVGGVARSLLLGPKGKLRVTLHVLRGSGRVGLVSDFGWGATTQAHLEQFLFRVDVSFALEEAPVFDLWGPRSADVLERSGRAVPDGWAADDLGIVARIGSAPDRFIATGVTLESLQNHGAERSGDIALTTVRIEAGEPLMGVDVDDGTIPHETGLVGDSVSFTKGCYVGQELVARIDSRGHVNRMLRGLVLQANVVPPTGARVVVGDLEAGVITSVGESLALRAPIAMGLLRREADPGRAVTLVWEGGSVEAVVHELPLDDFASA